MRDALINDEIMATIIQAKREMKRIARAKRNFSREAKSYIFVWGDGKIITTADIARIARSITRVNGTSEPHRYTAYSLRIGGTTLAARARIDRALILHYIGWSTKRLPHVSMGYIRWKDDDFVKVPRFMIHNANNEVARVYDPWTTNWGK